MSKTGYILALDLGGTHFRVALADRAGHLIERRHELTDAHEGFEAVLGRLKKALRDLGNSMGFDRIAAIALSVPGPVNVVTGEIINPPNLPGWTRVPFKHLIEEEFSIPTAIGNDANLGALGEHRFGGGRGFDHIVFLTISTGVGGGVIADGRLLLGVDGFAAEVGHMTIDARGERCHCGNIGCLETFVAGPWIARRAAQRLAEGESSPWLLEKIGSDLGQLTPELLVEAAQTGDPFAEKALREAGTALGIGLVNLVHLFNPQAIFVGGGMTNAGLLLLDPAREIVATRAMAPFRGVRISPALLGDDVSLMGAVALALDQLEL